MKSLNYRLLLWYYPLLLLVAYLQARAILPPYYEPLMGNVTLPFSLLIIYLGCSYYINNRGTIPLLNIYFIFSLFTVVSYSFNGRPIILYFQDVAYVSSTAMIAFMAAYKSIDKDSTFYKVILYSWLICFVVGLYLYFIRPEWYTNAIIEKHSLASWKNQMLSEEQILEQFRFGSFTLDSYAISFISMYLFPLILCYLFRTKLMNKWFLIFSIITVVIAAFLCMQRIVIVCLVFDLFLLFFIGEKKIKKTMSILIGIVAVLLIIFGGYLMGSNNNLVEMIVEGFGSDRMDDAVNGARLTQIRDAFSAWDNPITGQGIGSLGGRARDMGLTGVSDCCWVKLLCEQGLVGFTLFTIVMYQTLRRAFKYKKLYTVEICAIINILLAMLVSDPMYYQRYILPFWFMVGKIWNKSYLEKYAEVK